MKLLKIRRLVSFITCFSLVFQTFLPFTLALPAFADDNSVIASDSAAIQSPDVTPSVTPEVSPTPTPDVTVTPEPAVTPDVTPAPIQTVDDKTAVFDSVAIGQTYTSKDGKATVTFTEITGPSGNLTIKEITLTPEQIAESGAISDVAYDITSNMVDGTFKFDLTLPKPESQNVEVKYSEDGQDFITSGGVSTTADEVVVSDVNHFTIFVIAGVHLSSNVYINEFSYSPASNQWVELYNSSNSSVNLSGWHLRSDDKEIPLSGSITGHGFKTFDVTNLKNPSGNGDGDEIRLLDNSILFPTVDVISYHRCNTWWCVGIGSTPVSPDNDMSGKSIGRSTNGGDVWTSFVKPTKNYSNLGDSTAPIISYSLSAVQNAGGWNNTNVTIHWTVTDNESPILSSTGCTDVTISTETTGSNYTCTATSGGGTSSKTATIKLDKTAPQLVIGSYNAVTPTNQDIVVSATSTDGSLNESFHTFEANGSFTFIATDQAGNTTSRKVTISNIDKEKPAVPQNMGWSSDNPVTGSDYVNGTDFANYQTCGGYVNYSPMTNLWAPVSDAVSYDREVFSPEGNPVYSQTLSTNFVNGGGATDGNTYYIHVRSRDVAGNVSGWSPICSVKYDTTAPTAMFVFPVPSTSANSFSVIYSEDINGSDADNPANYYLQNWPGYSGSGNLSGHATVSYNSASRTAVVTFTTPGWYISAEQKWGVQNVHDLAGNQIDSSISYAYSSPLISPLAPTLVSSTPNPTNSVTQPWSWTAAVDPNGVLASGIREYWYMVSGSTNLPWTNAGNVLSLSTSLSEGNNQLSVKAFDNAGNEGAVASGSLLVDFTKPLAPTITAPNTGDYFKSSPILNQWTSVEDTSGIKEYRIEYIYDDGHTFSGAPYRTTTSTSRNHSPNITEQGGVTIRVQAIDNAENEGEWSKPVHYFYDATAPTASISYSNTSATQGPVVATLVPSETVTVTDSGGLFTHSFTENGSHTFHFVDAAGNTGEATATVSNIDKVAPIVAITAPTVILINGNVEIRGTVTDTNPHHYWLVIQNSSNVTVAGPGTVNFSSSFTDKSLFTWNTASVADGVYTIKLEARDSADNKDAGSVAWKTITLDKTAPVTTITNPGSSQFFNGAINISGNTQDISGVAHVDLSFANFNGLVCDDYSPIQTLTPESNTTNFVWNYAWTPSTQGSFCIKAAGTDIVGNEEHSAVVTGITYDTVNPTIGFISPTPNNNLLTNNNTQTFSVSSNEKMSQAVLHFGNGTGGFESSVDGWTTSGKVQRVSEQSYTGSYSLRVGDGHDWPGSTNYAYRTVTLPSSGSISLNAWIKRFANDSFYYDQQRIYVTDSSGNIIRYLMNTLSGDGTWVNVNYDLSDLHGQTIRIYFYTHDDGAGDPSWMYVDDVNITGSSLSSEYPMVLSTNGLSASYTYTGIADGTVSYYVTGTDLAQNNTNTETRSLTIDTKAPSLSEKTTFGEGWYNTDQEADFYFTDENGLTSENKIFCTISTEGKNQTCTVKPDICDKAGNCTEETFTSNGANIDKTNPVVSLTFNPATPELDNGWYKTQPEITINVVDANPELTQYQWDGTSGEWQTYVNPIKPLIEGEHTLYFQAFDKAKNGSGISSSVVKWDQTDIDFAPKNVQANPNPTSGTTSKITWEAAGDNVAVNRYEIKWTLNDSANPKSYSKTVASEVRETEIDQLIEGRWTVSVRAFDAAGHNKDAAIDLYVDRTAPAAPVLVLGATGEGTVSLSWNSIADAKDYIIWYGTATGERLYGARVGLTTSYTVRGLGAGNYYFIVRSVDGAQNQSAESNEVNTGAITGAANVAPGTPAQGFAPQVQGASTDATPSAETPSILGASTDEKGFNWWWLLLILIPLFFGVRQATKKNRQ